MVSRRKNFCNNILKPFVTIFLNLLRVINPYLYLSYYLERVLVDVSHMKKKETPDKRLSLAKISARLVDK